MQTLNLTVAPVATILEPTELDLTSLGFDLAPMGLVPIAEPTIQEWNTCGSALKSEWQHVSKRATLIQFAIGDWLNYGVDHWGDEIWNYLDPTDYAESTLKNFQSIARNVPLSRRNENLSYKHHSVVAKLSGHEQAEWLSKAERENLSANALYEQVNAEKAIAPSSMYQCPNCDSIFEITELKRVKQ